ncbi:MAG: efflux RND transporter periplasmic adaptor subunit [Alphaproteobacteria bacterium]|nr:efflux RND transporter periplasmic adaptor subunit [Alphaproteobacteria bacterium]
MPQYALRLLCFLTAGLLIACEEQNTYAPPPPPPVSVAKPMQKSVIDYLEFTGNTAGVESVELRARVPGFLKSVNFEPGTWVQAGDVLFVIDPREYEEDLQAAEAELASAKAQLERAEIELERAESLFRQQAGTEVDVVKWRGDKQISQAAVLRGEAKVERARLNLSYTQVTTPLSGRASRNLVDAGNLVGDSEPTLLTTVVNYQPIYVYFNLNERDLLRVYEMYRGRAERKGIDTKTDSAKQADIPLELGLANEEGYPHQGVLDFAEPGVDPATGTIQLRGIFPNKEQPPPILPGLFARVRMPVQERPDALLVTERAIGADQTGRYLLVANSENVVEKRPVRLGALVDGLQVIEEGLRPDDRVIVSGVQRARTGAKVEPKEVDMASFTTTALREAAEAKQEPAPSSEDKQSSEEAKDPAETPAEE